MNDYDRHFERDDAIDAQIANDLQVTFNVTVYTRERGAIGIFEAKDFTVKDLASTASHAEIFEAWKRQYGKEWEPRSMSSCSLVQHPPD